MLVSAAEAAKLHADLEHCIHEAADVLPHQGILQNFVHHNPFSEFEKYDYSVAQERIRTLEAYASPSERAFMLFGVDPRKRCNEALSELSSAFLDRGAAKWAAPDRGKGFLHFFASLESLGFAPWRMHARLEAGRILALCSDPTMCRRVEREQDHVAALVLRANLQALGVPQGEWENALRSMMRELRGWGGMFHRMECIPAEAPAGARVRLIDFAAVQSILIRSSIESLIAGSVPGTKVDSLSAWLSIAPATADESVRSAADVMTTTSSRRGAEPPPHESALAYLDQLSARQEQLEVDFRHTLLSAIGTAPPRVTIEGRPALQFWACIDDREGSFRRHVEEQAEGSYETFGIPGFFAMPIFYRPLDGREEMKLAPVPIAPKYTLVERDYAPDHAKYEVLARRRRVLAWLSVLYERATFIAPLSLVMAALLWPVTLARLFAMSFFPVELDAAKKRLLARILPTARTDFDIPFPLHEAAANLGSVLRDVGMTKNFARLVVVVGHGSQSANNPFASAYNCGACSGNEGGPNARLLARVANHPEVRELLRRDHGIELPDDCVWVGAVHNTCNDTFRFLDADSVPASHAADFERAAAVATTACERNALERCSKFLFAANIATTDQAVAHVYRRSVDPAEVRPELNHATDAAVVVGRRDLTKGRFLDRRVFLPSYDPFCDDERGTNLEHVLAPSLVVSSGINLEYLFSTVRSDIGAGTKAPLNVVGNIGVLQGVNGDLRTGLPTQMTEMHTPIRALFVIDAPVMRVEQLFARRPDLAQLVRNHWVLFVVRDPDTNEFWAHTSDGKYDRYVPEEGRGHAFEAFRLQREHGLRVMETEFHVYRFAILALCAAAVGPILVSAYAAGGLASLAQFEQARGAVIALCASGIAMPVFNFARRYLHGEHMFARYAALSVGLVLGFNIVATSTNLMVALMGWSLFGFSSTFLIGTYNDRTTVRNNATFAFAAYRVGDTCMMAAIAFATLSASASAPVWAPHAAAIALLWAALFKSSQFPMSAIFARSMEGPTPASALGYAGLAAHFGVVLLATYSGLWFQFEWARAALATTGLITAVTASLTAMVRSDRKGCIAYANSASVGLIYVVLAAGYTNLALVLCLGNAAFRITQVLRAPSAIADVRELQAALQHRPWHSVPSQWWYRAAWAARRFDTDFHFVHPLHMLMRRFAFSRFFAKRKFTREQQWAATFVVVMLTGFPLFNPLNTWWEHMLIDTFIASPVAAILFAGIHFAASVIAMRLLLWKVLDLRRFQRAPLGFRGAFEAPYQSDEHSEHHPANRPVP